MMTKLRCGHGQTLWYILDKARTPEAEREYREHLESCEYCQEWEAREFGAGDFIRCPNGKEFIIDLIEAGKFYLRRVKDGIAYLPGEILDLVDVITHCVKVSGICSICGGLFTDEEWENRHSDDDGGDCHAGCCEACKVEKGENNDGTESKLHHE